MIEALVNLIEKKLMKLEVYNHKFNLMNYDKDDIIMISLIYMLKALNTEFQGLTITDVNYLLTIASEVDEVEVKDVMKYF